MICIEITQNGQRRMIEQEIWVLRQGNSVIARCPRPKAQGVSDGELTWSLGSLDGYPEAKLITLAEYLEAPGEPDADPELTAEEALNIMMGGTNEIE